MRNWQNCTKWEADAKQRKHRAKREIKRTLKPGALDVPFREAESVKFSQSCVSVPYGILKQCVKCVRISKKCAGRHKRAVEDASPYMVCKVHNKVRITQIQIKMRNENRSALVSYQIIFPPHITMSGDTITSSGSPLKRVRSASRPTFIEPTRSDMPAISAAVQVIASMPFS